MTRRMWWWAAGVALAIIGPFAAGVLRAAGRRTGWERTLEEIDSLPEAGPGDTPRDRRTP